MASRPAFELEDQTDEDFFDKLVDDDDDINVSSYTKSADLKVLDLDDGHDSDEANTFGKLSSYSDESKAFATLNKDFDKAASFANLCDDTDEAKVVANVSNDSDDVSAFANLSVSESVDENEASEAKKKSDEGVGVEEGSGHEKDGNEGETGTSLASASSVSLDNGHTSSDHVTEPNTESELTSSKGDDSANFGAKVVQWSAFSDSSVQVSDAFGSYSDFYSEFGDAAVGELSSQSNAISSDIASKVSNSEFIYSQPVHQGEHISYTEQHVNEQELNSSQYWENAYPGWKYDSNSGQWYQVDGQDMTTNGQQSFDKAAVDMQGNFGSNAQDYLVISGGTAAQVFDSQQTAQFSVGTVAQVSIAENISKSNQVPQANGGYPAHIISDPQYPGWLYDANEQKWLTLEQYQSSSQSTSQAHDWYAQNGSTTTSFNNYQVLSSQDQQQNWNTASSGYTNQGSNAWQPEVLRGSNVVTDSSAGLGYQNASANNQVAQLKPYNPMESVTFHTNSAQSTDDSHWAPSKLVPGQQYNAPVTSEQNGHMQYSTNYGGSHKPFGVSEQFFPVNHQSSSSMNGGRASAGRPPHALVAFGFGGKLIVMKDSTSATLLHGTKEAEGYSISIINLMEAVMEKNVASGRETNTCDYLNALYHQGYPGPLVGGNVGGKELNKWIDERILGCSSDLDFHRGESLKLLLSLLKVSHQYYGKLRSSSTDASMRESDLPELAVANLFASAKENTGQLGQYGVGTTCVKNSPSQAQIQATASEVQNLLISGRRKEALQCAQEGQLWEFALILARELGEQSYADTVKQLALSQLVVGTPLRTLCLLIAKSPEDVFTSNESAATAFPSPAQIYQQPDQSVGYNMLDNWEENLAVITANRAENGHLVITHLGDCLWKERNDITAAHACYLVAGADIEAYSNSARLCLIGADHWNFPRTYATPDAIQRTEFYEYSKVVGNSQFVLLPFLPYKLIYAYMLAEIGKVSDSLKYCQAMYKSMKAVRSSEAEVLKQLLSSLEERLRTHQQGGYSANLAPGKIVGKLLNFIDTTAHRVVGGPPPPVPAVAQSFVPGNELHNQMNKVPSSQSMRAMSMTPSSSSEFVNQWAPLGSQAETRPSFSSGQSAMAMPSLMPSASMEPISQWAVDGNRMTISSRSISEPDIGKTSKQDQVDSSSQANSSQTESNPPTTSRLGRFSFGAQILQKTVGLVIKPRQGQQAKLGEENKFYYDKKLNRWVEEGAEVPAEEAAPPPPPTIASFQNTAANHNSQGPATEISPHNGNVAPAVGSPGIPSIPPSTNQFSARGRMGVRARYVDTFNKSGASPASASQFQSPVLPPVKPASVARANFFVPSPVSAIEQTSQLVAGSMQEVAESGDAPLVSMSQPMEESPPTSMQKFPSLGSIPNNGMIDNQNDIHSSFSRRTASWSGVHNNSNSQVQMLEVNSSREALGMSPLSNISSNSSSSNLLTTGDLGNELQEVKF